MFKMALPSVKEYTKPLKNFRPKYPRFPLYHAKQPPSQSDHFSPDVVSLEPSPSPPPPTRNFPMRSPGPLQIRPTSPLTWALAIICTIVTIIVIIGGIIVFIFYEVIRPKVPFVSLTYTHLDVFNFSQPGLLTTGVIIVMRWGNDNEKADARFYNSGFLLSFHGLEIAKLVSKTFGVSKNSSIELHYQVLSTPIPLSQRQILLVANSLKQDLVTFDLKGIVKTQWRVGLIGSVKFTLHLDCQLKFIYSTKDSIGLSCSSKSK